MDITSNKSIINVVNRNDIELAIGPDGDRSQSKDDLKNAATQFETIFLKMFLDQARESKLSDDLLGSSASDDFREMFDNEISKTSGKNFSLGLTDTIIRQLRIVPDR